MSTEDREEEDIIRGYEAGEWRSVSNLEQELLRYQEYAAAFLKDRKDHPALHLPLSAQDLSGLQERADKMGTSREGLVARLVRDYLSQPIP